MMNYNENYNRLKELYTATNAVSQFEAIEIHKLEFKSEFYTILPGVNEYYCDTHKLVLKREFSFYNDIGTIEKDVYIKDFFVKENQAFNYYLLKPKGEKKIKKVTFLLHGFNEKDWAKYLPWAKAICDRTNGAVVLFPLSFHMQRAPELWSNKRQMYTLSEARKARFPNIVSSTLSNVAISMRLHSMPQRFIWSGLQTYYDIIQFIEFCKSGKHKHINKDFEFDIFAYSIGGFLAQVLKLTNHKNYFDRSKVCLFCSGSTFNRFSPVSKFILDSEANVALYSFLVEHFDKMLEKDKLLNHFINEGHPEGKVFYAMLNYQKVREFRESLLRKYERDFYAITLKQDKVIPSFEIMNTLKGAYREIGIQVDELDFSHFYTHEDPFPINEGGAIDESFNLVFDKAGAFFNR